MSAAARLSLAMALAMFLRACPAADPSPDPRFDPLPLADLLEEEPNGEVSQALGVLRPRVVVGGAMSACGEDGSYEGSDVDRFSFAVEEPVLIHLQLLVRRGDLDLRLFDPQGELMADEDGAGAEGEALQFSIGPGAAYEVELRCWMGQEPDWRLVFALGTLG